MNISLDAEKAFDKIQHPFMLNVLERPGIQSPYLNIVKTIFSKPIASIKLQGEKIERIPLKLRMKQGCQLSPYLFNIGLKGFTTTIIQLKEVNGIQIGNK